MKNTNNNSFKYYIRQITACFLSIWLFFGPSIASAEVGPDPTALPSGHSTPYGGVGSFDYGIDPITSNPRLDIQAVADGAVINWANFDIGANATTQFHQLADTAAVLNRVQDVLGLPTGIDGSLIANGRVFIVNPAGVVFGSGASVNVAQLVASSLDITDVDFRDGDGEYTFFDNPLFPTTGDIENNGDIMAVEGVAMLGKSVRNAGTIVTQAGGFVAMAAGDRVLLGQPGSKIVVEMDSATGVAEDVGNVVNTGLIDSPEGKIVLAAGDIYSAAINIGAAEVAVQSGTGTVEQNGTIHADGTTDDSGTADGGEVILTAGDEVYLGDGSLTTANAGSRSTTVEPPPDGGDVLVYSPVAVTSDAGAVIEAKGSGIRYDDPVRQLEVTEDYRGSVEISGTRMLLPTQVDISNDNTVIDSYNALIDPDVNPELVLLDEPGYLTVHPPLGDLQIVEGPMPATPADNTIYEEWIETMSRPAAGTAPSTVGLDIVSYGDLYVDYMNDQYHEILGGSGDITLRTQYDDGGIFFENVGGETTTIHTTACYDNPVGYGGGNIYMIAGSGGIHVGDLTTDTLNNDKASNPGRIRLMTVNGGDIETGTMYANRGSITEVSAIASGNLIVNGDVLSHNATVSKDEKAVGFALVCLIADENVNVTGSDIEVAAHGKFETTANIRICAGKEVHLTLADGVSATAQTSENTGGIELQADATVVIGAGSNNFDPQDPSQSIPGVIEINGSQDVTTFPVALEAKISGTGGSVQKSPAEIPNPGPSDPPYTWQDTDAVPGDYYMHVKLTIDNDSQTPPSDPASLCYDCPKPPGLPPVPHLFFLLDDFIDTYNKTTVTLIDAWSQMLNNDDDGGQLDGTVSEFTTAQGGTLIPVYEVPGDPSSPIVGFEYTPPVGAVYVVDAGDPTVAYYYDSYTYKAIDSEGVESINTATVPLADGGFATTPKEDAVDISEADAVPGIVEFMLGQDPDGDPIWIDSYTPPTEGTLTPIYDPANPTHIIGFNYDPAAAFETFTYTVTDGYNVSTATLDNPGEVTINLTNELPLGAVTNILESKNDTSIDVQGGAVPTYGFVVGSDPDGDDVWIVDSSIDLGALPPGTITEKIYDGEGHLIGFKYTPDLSQALFSTINGGQAETVSYAQVSYQVTDGYNVSQGNDGGIVNIDLYNLIPIAVPDNYAVGAGSSSLVVPQDTGVIVGYLGGTDLDLDGDTLAAFIDNGGFTSEGGSITLNGNGSFTYVPPTGFAGTDSFTYHVSDGYNVSQSVLVTIDVTGRPPTPLLPPAPLPDWEEPEIEGCPVLLDVVATELDVTSGTIQVSINRSLATAPNIQPCDACARFMNYAGILSDPNGSRIAAMVQVFNEIAPADTPPSEEMFASIATAFSQQMENEDMPQYATAMEFLDAFVAYISILDNELGSPVGDSTAFALSKHGGSEMMDNPNILAYVQTLLASAGQ
ncbi:MAG: filamentous hemagglutinin N-terminal domain-containing protein [Planctomycetota bacterium]|jgi:filamentous hemagglutinin family protein